MSLAALAGRSAASLRGRIGAAACIRSASVAIAAPAPAPAFAACSIAPAASARAFHASSAARGLFGFGGSKDSADKEKQSKDSSATPAPSASTPATATSSSGGRPSSRPSPSSSSSGLDAERAKAAEKMAKESRMQAEAEATFWSAFKAILLRPEFKLKDYEELSKLQAGGGTLGGDTSNMSMFDRAKYKLREKVQSSGLVPEQQTHAELKPVLAVLAALTPAEKDTVKAGVPLAVRERVALSTGQSLSELRRFFMKFDQLSVVSQWFKWRVAQKLPLPSNHQQMQDWMSDDRREKKWEVKSKLELSLKPKVRKRY